MTGGVLIGLDRAACTSIRECFFDDDEAER
jgi:hypothetical protein